MAHPRLRLLGHPREIHGLFIGDIGFADFKRDANPSIENTPEAGWALTPTAHGKGYANEALTAALQWLDTATPHTATVCLIDPGNTASLRLAAKHLFTPSGPVTLGPATPTLFTRTRPNP